MATSTVMISSLIEEDMSSSSSEDEDAVLAEQEKEEFEKRKRNIKQQREIQLYLASRSPEELFIEFDADKSGKIEFDEFRMMLKRLNIPMEEAKALKYFRNIDEDNSGAIDLPEFKTALYAADPVSGNPFGFAPSSLLTPEDAFKMFDEDNSGQIDEDEFADILEYMGMDVSDSKQEKMFKKFDRDKSGYIDFDEFREVWARVSNVREELRKRNIPFNKFTPSWVLRKKLNRAINKEEDDEARSIAQAQHWKKWQDEIRAKKECYQKARLLADDTLAHAMDAGGQVYVFGNGTHGQFAGKTFNHRFQEYGRVQRAWEARVATSEENKRLRREEKASIVRIGLEPRLEKPPPSAVLWANPFGACNVQVGPRCLHLAILPSQFLYCCVNWCGDHFPSRVLMSGKRGGSVGHGRGAHLCRVERGVRAPARRHHPVLGRQLGLLQGLTALVDRSFTHNRIVLRVCDGDLRVCDQPVFSDDVALANLEEKRGPMLTTPRSQRLKSTLQMETPELENTFEVDMKVSLILAVCRQSMLYIVSSLCIAVHRNLQRKQTLRKTATRLRVLPRVHPASMYDIARVRALPLCMHWITLVRTAKTFKVQHFKIGLLPKVGKTRRVVRQLDCCRRSV